MSSVSKRSVIGGISLGADVALQVALIAPLRVQAMVLEMPVLESAHPIRCAAVHTAAGGHPLR